MQTSDWSSKIDEFDKFISKSQESKKKVQKINLDQITKDMIETSNKCVQVCFEEPKFEATRPTPTFRSSVTETDYGGDSSDKP